MKIMKILEEHIGDEIHDMKEYAELAMEYKDECPELADLFYNLSTEEKHHADMLHEKAVGELEKYRKTHGEPPVEILAVYAYIRCKNIKKMEKAERIRAMYKR